MNRYGWSCPGRLTTILLLASLLNAGCGTMFPRYLGIRPDAPEVKTPPDITTECAHRHTGTAERIACEQYLNQVQWAQQLGEAYRTRATLNEWAIYVAGTIALAGLSAISALGLAATASTETIGLIGVSTGFTSGFFGFMNNSARAGFYTTAANDISTALSKATKKVGASPTSTTYDEATKLLAETVSQTANQLETRRYDAAAAAATSQQTQKAEQERQELMSIIETSMLAELRPDTAKEGDTVVIVTSGVDLTKYKDRVRVFVGGRPVPGEVTSKTEIKFKILPPVPPASTKDNVRVYLGAFPVPGERPLTYK